MASVFSKKVLNKTVLLLGAVSFLNDLSSEMLYPVMPFFLINVIGTSTLGLGIVDGFAEAVSHFVKIFSGAWSDRIQNRKRFVFVGYLISAICKPLMGASTQVYQVLVAKSVDRFGKGIRSAPRDALLAENVEASVRSIAFGWHRLMDTLGAICGPLLALWFLNMNSQNLRWVFYVAFIPGFISCLFVLLLKEKKKTAPQKKTQVIQSFPVSSSLKKFLIVWFIFCLGGSSDSFLLLKIQTEKVDFRLMIFAYCLYNLSYAALSPYLGKLADEFSKKKVLFLGFIIYGLVYLGFAYLSSIAAYFILFVIYGSYVAATEGISKTHTLDFAQEDNKGTILGLLGLTTGVAIIIANIFAGLLWKYNPSYTFLFGAAMSFLASLLLVFIG